MDQVESDHGPKSTSTENRSDHRFNSEESQKNHSDKNEIGSTSSDAAMCSSVSTVLERSIHHQMADILKMDIDCCEEAFDYLTMRDLLNVGQTCQRLNQVVGYIFRQNYRATECDIYDYKVNKCNISIGRMGQPNCFNRFIQKLNILYDGGLQRFRDVQSQFHRLKRVHLMGIQLKTDSFEQSKGIFNKIEFLKLHNCMVQGDFHSSILSCPNIKRLCIRQTLGADPILIGNSNNWLHQKYPLLEHFEIDTRNEEFNIAELTQFLELNPNIRKLTVPDRLTITSDESSMGIKVKLDELIISGSKCDAEFFDLIKRLHDQGSFERLKLYFQFVFPDQLFIDQIASLNALVTLRIGPSNGNPVELSGLNSLEELCIVSKDEIKDFLQLPDKLNLKRLEFLQASSDDLLPFIREATNLERIKVRRFKDGAHFNGDLNVLDLVALNYERGNLENAAKITIHVEESTYLATKWTLTETDLNLIRIKRIESFEWEYCFGNDT